MADSNILSDFGINILEQEIDDVIFQTNEFLCDATFTGSQGPFWWLVQYRPLLLIQVVAVQCFVILCSVRQISNGTKTGQNHRKIRSGTLLNFMHLQWCITLSCTKVQICPVKTEQFYLFLSLTNTFSDYCTTRDNTSTFYIPVYPFSEYVYVKQCFHSFGQ